MLGAAETPYDLRFRLLDVPVRVHPFFWLVAVVLGWQNQNLPAVALWVACVFVSIVVHEYGHALTAKAFDASPSILLWGLGGLCYSDGERQSPGQRLLVILAGPGAGFVLLGVVLLVYSGVFGISLSEHMSVIGSLFGAGPGPVGVQLKMQSLIKNDTTYDFLLNAYWYLVQINLRWGLVNLLPMWPLDGGQATQILLTRIDRSRGQRWTHVVSLLVSGMLAIMLYLSTNDIFYTVFFAYFAIINFQVIQSIHQAHSMGLYQEDDWWRR
jgi:Zn-dependent protease